MQNELAENITYAQKTSQFRNSIKKAIDVRERALFPQNALCALPIDVKTEEIIQKEQLLLMSVLEQFDALFKVVPCSE